MLSAFLTVIGIVLAVVFIAGLAVYGVVKLVLSIIGATAGGVMNGFDKIRRK